MPPTPPLPLNFIQFIQASQCTHPLYDHRAISTQTYYAAGSETVWVKNGPIPVAVSATTPFTITLTPEGIVALNSLTKPSISAALGLDPVSAAKVFEHEVGVPLPAMADALAKDLEKFILVKPTFNSKERPIPWRIAGNLVWTLKGTKPQDPQYVCTTVVKIYALPPTLPAFYQFGIPLALLREPLFLPAWMQSDATDWPSFVVQAMTADARWEHRSWNSSCRYVSTLTNWLQHFVNNGSIDCWLDLWLTDLSRIKFNGGAKIPVNAFDIAALTQVVAGLGLEDGTETCLHYMTPFGFIKPTKVLGRTADQADPRYPDNTCNNPSYGMRSPYGGTWNVAIKCDDDDAGRSAFRDHIVFAIKGSKARIFDACCGPHLSDEDLDAYLAATLDTQTKLYNQPPARFEMGGRTSVIDSIGVGQLVSSSAFTTFSAQSLINRLEERFHNDGIWSTPYITAPAGPADVVATWCWLLYRGQSNRVIMKV
jgi:hypothetical protein